MEYGPVSLSFLLSRGMSTRNVFVCMREKNKEIGILGLREIDDVSYPPFYFTYIDVPIIQFPLFCIYIYNVCGMCVHM